jgi:tRNA-dihydrouridine synthase C
VLPALAIRGRTGAVRFPTACLLAPMEGITDPQFRALVLPLGGVGGASTEFVRISVAPVPVRVCRRHLGAPAPVPVAVQLMAAGPEHVAVSAANAEQAGAAWVDLNFGCPAPVVFGKCAGAALLDRPEAIAAITAAAVAGTGLPVSVKLRAGIDSDRRLEECLHAAAGAGAAMITLHARLRTTA